MITLMCKLLTLLAGLNVIPPSTLSLLSSLVRQMGHHLFHHATQGSLDLMMTRETICMQHFSERVLQNAQGTQLFHFHTFTLSICSRSHAVLYIL